MSDCLICNGVGDGLNRFGLVHLTCVEKKTMPEAVKNDKDKTQWDLLPLKCMEEVMKVYTYGMREPGREKNQWRYGTKWSRYWNATMRHIIAFWRGEELDKDSGLHHLAHAICDLMMLFEMLPLIQFDDRENWMGEKDKKWKIVFNYQAHQFQDNAAYPGVCNFCGKSCFDDVHTDRLPLQRIHKFKHYESRPHICISCGEEKDHMIHAKGAE